MDRDNCVLEISSDEEEEVVKDQQVDLEWFRGQLFKDIDDSDDVVVVREVLNNKQLEVYENCLTDRVAVSNADWSKVLNKHGDVDEDDDDCVVLDGDPDKMVSVNETQDDESDELVVVGEKGQVACRDYPHPRHLCVKYPFSSTLHKFHCELCHCYICDTVAPCNLWGNGMSIVDHCHATDKLEVWKTERKNFKLKRCSSLPSTKSSENPSSATSTMSTQIPNQPHPLTRSVTMPNSRIPLSSLGSDHAVRSVLSPPVFRPLPSAPVVRPVPSAPNLHVQSTVSPRPQISISRLTFGGCTKVSNQRVANQNATVLGPQSIPFKRTRPSATYRAGIEYHSGYGQPQSSVSSYTLSTIPNQPVSCESSSGDYHAHQWENSGSNMSTGALHNQLPQSNYMNMPNITTLYQDVMSSKLDTLASLNVNKQVACPPIMTTSLSDVSATWVESSNAISTQWTQTLLPEFASHNDSYYNNWTDETNVNSRQWNQLESPEVSQTPNTYTPWAIKPNSSQQDQHLQSNDLGIQGPQSVNAASNYLQDEQSGNRSSIAVRPADQASAVPELENLRFEFEDWLMENQPTVGNSIEPPFFSDQNILSPEDAHIDSVLVYEDDWNFMANIADM